MFSSRKIASTKEEKATSEQMIDDSALSLGPDLPFQHFALSLNDQEKQALDQLTISKQDNIVYLDSSENLTGILEITQRFLIACGEKNPEIALTVANIVLKTTVEVLKMTKQEAFLLEIRASIPHDRFKTTHWHTDGYYYFPKQENQYRYKALISLLGPGTLFYKLPTAQRQHFNEIQMDRQKTAEMLKDVVPEVAPPDSGTLMIIGHSDHAAVHSEPDINRNRLFVSIAPGSRQEIQSYLDTIKKIDSDDELQQFIAEEEKSSGSRSIMRTAPPAN